MYSRILTASLYGLSGEKTWTEVDVETGMPAFSVVGLPNRSIREAKERIHSAIDNCGFSFDPARVTVNLTPANKQKDGSHYDLAIALGYLASSGQIKCEVPGEHMAFLGELTLNGDTAPAEGLLPMAIGLKRSGVKTIMIPEANTKEARLVKGLTLIPVKTLSQAAGWLEGTEKIEAVKADGSTGVLTLAEAADFSDIKGQELVKRASQLAAAGMHGMLMIGPPGVGKSMVGKRIPGILPPLTYNEQLDITQIYSAAGELREDCPLISARPFRAPHHSISTASLIGGGAKPKPGEISLAHTGVMFLDELPEFSAHTLDTLRQPLEDGFVCINRINGKCVYPARFMLVAAMNPCRCGYYGDPVKECKCSETDRKKYIGKVSGPLLDRIDLHIAMERVIYKDIAFENTSGTDTAALREGVMRAAAMQKERYKNLSISRNSELTPGLMEKYCRLKSACEKLMQEAFERLDLSARSYHRILKLARTAADLDGCGEIGEKHILEALNYRKPEKYFG